MCHGDVPDSTDASRAARHPTDEGFTLLELALMGDKPANIILGPGGAHVIDA
jgi:hypothetical protein